MALPLVFASCSPWSFTPSNAQRGPLSSSSADSEVSPARLYVARCALVLSSYRSSVAVGVGRGREVTTPTRSRPGCLDDRLLRVARDGYSTGGTSWAIIDPERSSASTRWPFCPLCREPRCLGALSPTPSERGGYARARSAGGHKGARGARRLHYPF